ncbi:MAG: hypothetical protein M3552_20895, partial [Planctomycetota bacterium]|nr:hypothetical protein [Planctomycetota bacterium]
SDDAKSLLARLLGSDGLKQVTSERLTSFEAAHIRDALLDFSTADTLSRGTEQDIDRFTRLFEYVTRTVSAQATGTADLPLTAYEAHLFGRGSAEDRAWLFANLVRQLRTDAVVLRPADATDSDPWWVGVLLDDGVYLFDTSLGLPVPAPEQANDASGALLPRPATWAEAVATPTLLTEYRQQAGLDPQPIDAARLQSPRVELIGPSSFWNLAMERLELSLTEDRGVLLYDPLHSTPAGPGMYERVAAAGGSFWTADAIGVWPHTEEIRVARQDLPASQQQRLQQRIRPYLGPVRINTKGPEPFPEPPSRDLWETRIEHMSGRSAAARGSYQLIRLAAAPVLANDDPSAIVDALLSSSDQSLNSQAADEAFYWMAQAQYAERDFATAAATAQRYIDEGGDRSDEAAGLRVLCLAAEGQTEQAAEAVAELPETIPGLRRLQWFAERWRKPAPE